MGKPSYLPLLNTIAVNEKKGEQFLSAWADATPDDNLAEVLRFVAIREGEHAWAFTKRLCELGYAVSEADAYDVFGDFDALLSCVSSEASDLEKIERVTGGNGNGDGRDPFGRLFEDVTIDPETGALLGRYIAEERDSGRRLTAAYSAARERAGDDGRSAEELAELKATIKALKKEVKALKRLQ
ncbi:MAG: hypothetical protein AAGE43_09130 [Pseudomonadota bacterium]